MPVEVMFVAITGIIATFFVVKMGIRHSERRLELMHGAGNDRTEAILAATQQEVARLRERVQVLERLVTDDERRLAGEIRRLDAGPRS